MPLIHRCCYMTPVMSFPQKQESSTFICHPMVKQQGDTVDLTDPRNNTNKGRQ
ncbi:hypothetical protein BTU51_0142 [Rickettsia rickettsii]|uniref:Uncharacterized protein n=1 Tax=Rickettsia rickettsii (strain Iowa) TaxID=452659 RepID=B0BW35_RICRO|nr:hypothetical protein RrIowa_0142 [Rickettsia rickettsii str. Iowa]APU55013.1 hypothetical protein BTU50_0142 [Rickettsia rickettsii]APU56390.1 hypothetical protein BTU51_0142 [Rickettsia rickettsii]